MRWYKNLIAVQVEVVVIEERLVALMNDDDSKGTNIAVEDTMEQKACICMEIAKHSMVAMSV